MAKEVKNLYQRMLGVMEDVKYIQKETKKVNNQYSFVSHDAVTKALHDPLVKHGILMIPTVKEMRQEGNRTVAVVDVTFVNVDNSEDRLTVSYFGYGIDTQDKGPGKAISYAVKYALLKVFCLETGDDPERDSIEYTPSKLSVDQVAEIVDLLDGDQELKTKVLRFANVNEIKDITSDKYDVIIKRIKATKVT